MSRPPYPFQSAPAALRNREPIVDVLRPALPARRTVLEIASGTGEHVTHFATAFPGLRWQPSDPNADARASIAAWTEAGGLTNVRPAIDLDVHDRPWPVDDLAAILCINMVHISPWSATEALMAEAGRLLPQTGLLYLYGPYIRSDILTAESNIAFDASLRQRNPDWGLRELETLIGLANVSGLILDGVVDMPANNLSVLFRRK
jgi:SAM-dependent methyltransferase